MTDNREIKVGDYVEVKFRGFVTYNDVNGSETLQIAPDRDPWRKVNSIEGHMVTVLAPPVKVGDVVKGDRARELPIGSVVLYEAGGGASIKVNETEWASGEEKSMRVPTWLSTVKLRVLHVGNES